MKIVQIAGFLGSGKTTLARLEAKGYKASADLTMREIAVNNGFSRPFELIEILRPPPQTSTNATSNLKNP